MWSWGGGPNARIVMPAGPSRAAPPAYLQQDQFVVGGGERDDVLLLLEGWSVGDLFWVAVAIGVSLFVLNLVQTNTMIFRGKSVLHILYGVIETGP